MRRLMMMAAGLGLLAAGRAEAGLTLVAAAGPGVNLSNIQVGQTFEIDVLVEQTNPNDTTEHITTFGGGFFFTSSNLAFVSDGVGPNYAAPLATNPVLFFFNFTAASAGPASFYDSFGNNSGTITTNEATYSPTSNTLSFTIQPAATATPEPATLGSMALAAIGSGIYGWRRRRRSA